MKDIVQKICPECGEEAATIFRDRMATRTCPNGHQWFPIKNYEPPTDAGLEESDDTAPPTEDSEE